MLIQGARSKDWDHSNVVWLQTLVESSIEQEEMAVYSRQNILCCTVAYMVPLHLLPRA